MRITRSGAFAGWIWLLFLFATAADTRAETRAYIPNQGAGAHSMTRVITATDVFTRTNFSGDFAQGAPFGAAVMPDGSFVLVTLSAEDQLIKITDSFFATNPNSPAASLGLAAGSGPRGVAVDTRGLYAYVANFDADTISKIDVVGTLEVVGDPFEVGDGPLGVAAFFDEAEEVTRIYVSNHNDDSVSVITDDHGTLTAETIRNVGIDPAGLAITPDGRYLYVANYTNGVIGTVSIIQTSDNQIVKTITLGNGPWGVAVGADGAYVYVTNSEDLAGSVSVIRTSDQTVFASYTVGSQPMGVAAPKNGDFAYVVNQTDNSVTRIEINEEPEEIGVDRIESAFALGQFIGGTPPSAPSDLQAEADSEDTIELTWEDNSSDELGFKVERREEGEIVWAQIARVDANVTQYTDAGLADETTYTYRVRAYNEAADSSCTGTVEATTEEGDFSWCFVGTLVSK